MQSEFPHLGKPPIREAVLDIKVEPREGLTSEMLAAFVDRVKTDVPDQSPIRTVQAEIDVRGEQGVRSLPPQTLGTICWNESKTRAVQGRCNGFSVNHVQGYESWPVLREQAKKLWLQYTSVAEPKRVVRCALRYINRFELPVLVDMSTSLLTRPELGGALPQLVDEFFMRVVVPFTHGRKASLTQASEPLSEERSETRGLILDIDAFSTNVFGIGDDAMWREFEELRVIKNQCFFSSLQPSTWEAFQ